jgi:hypothetical protein
MRNHKQTSQTSNPELSFIYVERIVLCNTILQQHPLKIYKMKLNCSCKMRYFPLCREGFCVNSFKLLLVPCKPVFKPITAENLSGTTCLKN